MKDDVDHLKQMEIGSYFPILIKYSDTGELIVIKKSKEIILGRNFSIVRTSARPKPA